MSEPQKIAFHNLFLELSKGLLSVDSVNVLVGYLLLITTDSYQNMTGSQYDDNSQSWSSAEQSPVPRSSVALQNICNFVGQRENI